MPEVLLISGSLRRDSYNTALLRAAAQLLPSHAWLDGLAGFRTVAEWGALLAEFTDSLAATAPADDWQRAQLTTLLDELVGEATEATGDDKEAVASARHVSL